MSDQIRVSILGATGSVGQSALDVVASEPETYKVAAVTANQNVQALAEAAVYARAETAVIADPERYEDLKDALSGSDVAAAAGPEAICDAAAQDADRVVSAIVGAAGLNATLAAVKRGATVALANKESLVCSGPLMIEEARASGAQLLPIDSEHSAIFQVMDRPERVEKLVLTASGGPFLSASMAQMAAATPEQACAHPNWSMGAKISVDSATMMNKGLELIEAVYLFETPADRIDVLVHPQSIIHSLVSYDDGSVLAQLGAPDMRTPISYALAWPKRMRLPGVERLDLAKIARLDFEDPDEDRFPALKLARRAVEAGPWGPAVLNAANEVAVDAFLQKHIGFLAIAGMVQDVLDQFGAGERGDITDPESFEQVFDLDRRARDAARSLLQQAA
ncbi:MAG: 1-deoxy-D-xylulose-5-phosphate reductoisomerase [Pseudomonadota bacterium]